MLIVLLGIGLGWCFVTTLLGLSRIYIYIWFSQFGIDGLLTIIFCELIGGAMDIAKVQHPITPITEEELYISSIYIKEDTELIDQYVLSSGILIAIAAVMTITFNDIPHIVWEMQGLSVLSFAVMWIWFLWKERENIVSYLISIGINVALVLAVITVFEGDINAILLYTTVHYQFVFPYIYRRRNKLNITKRQPNTPTSEYEDPSYTDALNIGVISAHLVGTNKSLLSYLLEEKNSKYGYQRLMLMNIGGNITSLLLAIYSLGSRDASANYIAMVLRDVQFNNFHNLLCILFMFLCLFYCKCLHSASATMLQCCTQHNTQTVLNVIKMISLISVATITLHHWPLYKVGLILLISFCNLQFNKKNDLKPFTSSIGLQTLPIISFCKLI